MADFFDERLSTTGNVMAVIGVVMTFLNNAPQIYHTTMSKEEKKMEDFNFISIILRVISHILWLIYAIGMRSTLLETSVVISLFSSVYLLLFKLKDPAKFIF